MSRSVRTSKSMELNALQLREQKLRPYLTMLDEIMATMPERKEFAGHIYRLIRMTDTKDLDAAIRVHEYMSEERKPSSCTFRPRPAKRRTKAKKA